MSFFAPDGTTVVLPYQSATRFLPCLAASTRKYVESSAARFATGSPAPVPVETITDPGTYERLAGGVVGVPDDAVDGGLALPVASIAVR